MNKEHIKKELRRSACYDEFPFVEVKDDAFDTALDWSFPRSSVVIDVDSDGIRTFFLFVAEAIE